MALSEEQHKLNRELIALARSKGFAEHSIELILMLICTKDMVAKVGSTEEATRRAIEFCKQSETEQDCIEAQLQLIGIDD